MTLDTGCINSKRRDEALNTLERWAVEGFLRLQRSDAMLKELIGHKRREKAQSLEPHPGLFTIGLSMIGGPDVIAGEDGSDEFAALLFPQASVLTENQTRDVEHLSLHVQSGGDAFVTLNTNDFIVSGRQQTLRRVGVWVLTPTELVGILKGVYGWA